jgi:hypothetical protein
MSSSASLCDQKLSKIAVKHASISLSLLEMSRFDEGTSSQYSSTTTLHRSIRQESKTRTNFELP